MAHPLVYQLFNIELKNQDLSRIIIIMHRRNLTVVDIPFDISADEIQSAHSTAHFAFVNINFDTMQKFRSDEIEYSGGSFFADTKRYRNVTRQYSLSVELIVNFHATNIGLPFPIFFYQNLYKPL